MALTLYFLKGYLDVAAVNTSDLATLAAALANPLDETNATALANVTSKVGSLTQGDTGFPLTLYFYDDATTVSSWVANANVTLAVGLGDPDVNGSFAFASLASLTGSPRTGNLDLSGQNLKSALGGWYGFPTRNARGGGDTMVLHARKTTAGVTETVARLPVQVIPTVSP